MTTKEKTYELFKLALAIAHAELNECPDVTDRSRYTYAACATFRSRFNTRPTQNMIDAVRFNYIWF